MLRVTEESSERVYTTRRESLNDVCYQPLKRSLTVLQSCFLLAVRSSFCCCCMHPHLTCSASVTRCLADRQGGFSLSFVLFASSSSFLLPFHGPIVHRHAWPLMIRIFPLSSWSLLLSNNIPFPPLSFFAQGCRSFLYSALPPLRTTPAPLLQLNSTPDLSLPAVPMLKIPIPRS